MRLIHLADDIQLRQFRDYCYYTSILLGRFTTSHYVHEQTRRTKARPVISKKINMEIPTHSRALQKNLAITVPDVLARIRVLHNLCIRRTEDNGDPGHHLKCSRAIMFHPQANRNSRVDRLQISRNIFISIDVLS
jgi:hypothetical protein